MKGSNEETKNKKTRTNTLKFIKKRRNIIVFDDDNIVSPFLLILQLYDCFFFFLVDNDQLDIVYFLMFLAQKTKKR